MSKIAIINGQVVSGGNDPELATVLIEDSRIIGLQPENSYPDEAAVIDADGGMVVPGFIDIHVHGGGGHNFMDATPDSIQGMSRFLALHGVTSFLPTTSSAPTDLILASIQSAAEFQRAPQKGARIVGVHLEGPYLSLTHPGAHQVKYIRPADPVEYTKFFAWDNIQLISLAPEIPENLELLKYARSRGASVAVGHSGASYEEVRAAVDLGLNQACHTFNGMGGMHHRQPGTAGAVLALDEIYAQIIMDLVHVHPAVVKLLVKAKGVERTILITDALHAAGLPEGEYEILGQTITVSGGVAFLTYGNSLAGSILTMDKAVQNAMQATGYSLSKVLPMATSTPATSLGLGDELGSILPGYTADLLVLNQNFKVRLTMVQGQVVYQADSNSIRGN